MRPDELGLNARGLNMNLHAIFGTFRVYVPQFTRIEITLQLPIPDSSGQVQTHPIDFEGVVVWIEPKHTDGSEVYNFAMAFDMVKPELWALATGYMLTTIVPGEPV